DGQHGAHPRQRQQGEHYTGAPEGGPANTQHRPTVRPQPTGRGLTHRPLRERSLEVRTSLRHHNTTPHDKIKHNTTQHSTAQHSTAQHDTATHQNTPPLPASRHPSTV